MTTKIQILPVEEALKIAAGEVIERPVHVVKELVENALDASATTITLFINDAGKSLIRVVDNGDGMLAEDAILCFLPHATSKINTIHDLASVQTFGFRGEALASIASISRVCLSTRSRNLADDALGVQIEYSDSQLLKKSEITCPVGTDIQVQDLFFNTPVRKKFLKQDETEWNAVQNMFHAFCISNVNVHFKLYRDDKLILNAPPVATPQDRALQLWEYNAASGMIPLMYDDTSAPWLTISGFISNHNVWRYGKQNIHFFVNKRWVKNTELTKGLMKGFLNVLPPERFPQALIFLTVDPTTVDINIHPKKEEVKFERPGVVQSILASSVKKTLEGYVAAQCMPKHIPTAAPATPFFDQKKDPIISAPGNDVLNDVFAEKNFNFIPEPFPAKHYPVQESISSIEVVSQVQNVISAEEVVKSYGNIIGQIFKTYIIIERSDELVIIDQHAAHERILYEKYQTKFEVQHGTALLFPEAMRLPRLLLEHIISHRSFFEAQGLEIDVLGDSDLIIRTAPPQLRGTDLREFINDAALFIQEYEKLDKDLFRTKMNDYLHSQMACKSAIKAGDVLSLDQMNQLVNDLQKVANRFICVHGRPTTWNIPKNMLEKKFRRS